MARNTTRFADPPTTDDDADPEENQWRYTLDHFD